MLKIWINYIIIIIFVIYMILNTVQPSFIYNHAQNV